MKEIAKKLQEQEKIISKEKGPFELFALFLRNDSPDKWDLVLAADWITKDTYSALKYFSDILHKILSTEELIKFSRIAIIESFSAKDLMLEKITKAIKTEHNVVEIENSNFFDQFQAFNEC